jgi:hypothetical protein
MYLLALREETTYEPLSLALLADLAPRPKKTLLRLPVA